MHFSDRPVFVVTLLGLVAVGSSLFSWFFLQSIGNPSFTSIMGAVCVGIGVLSVLLFLMLVATEWWVIGVALGVFFGPWFFFLSTFPLLLGSLVAASLFFLSFRSILRERDDRRVFRVLPIISSGAGACVFGLSVFLSGGYFGVIQHLTWAELVPKLAPSGNALAPVLQGLGRFVPSMSGLATEEATIDSMLRNATNGETKDVRREDPRRDIEASLMELRKKGVEVSFSQDFLDLADAKTEEVSLSLARQKISDVVGREVRGDEKVSDVFSEAIEQRLLAWFSSDSFRSRVPNQTLPFLFATLFFLTLWPVTSILFRLFMVPLSATLFRLSCAFGILSVSERMRPCQVVTTASDAASSSGN